MAACSHGAGYSSCPPLSVAKEFNQADKGTGILRHHRADGGATVDEIVSAATQLARQPMQAGGFAGFSAENPWWERAEARQIGDKPYGFSVGSGGGRTDRNNVNVASGSYVLPADVVSGLGEGNSLAGAAAWDKILHSLPYGIHAAAAHRGMGPPHPPSGLSPPGQGSPPGIAKGGTAPAGTDTDGEVPIQAADGEIIVHPDDVKRFGIAYMPDGMMRTPDTLVKYGHSVLDEFVKVQRGRNIKAQEELPGPVNSDNSEKGHHKAA